MSRALFLVATAVLLATGVRGQCPTCDATNGAQTVCVVDSTTQALQQFLSLCEMDLFNCQNNYNVFQPLYYGTCQTSSQTSSPYNTACPNSVYATQPSYYPSSAYAQQSNAYYPSGSAYQYPYQRSGTDANGDWAVRLLSNINPAFYQRAGGANPNLVAPKQAVGAKLLANAVPLTTANVSPANTAAPVYTAKMAAASKTFAAPVTAYKAGAVYNLAARSGSGGGYAVAGSKAAGVATRVAGNVAAAPAAVVKPWASNKG